MFVGSAAENVSHYLCLLPFIISCINSTNLLPERTSGRTLTIRILHIPCILGLILAIVGGTRLSSGDPSRQSSGEHFEKAGGLMFVAVYIVLVGLCLLTFTGIQSLSWSERRIFGAICAALPLLAVRLLYSILSDFLDNSTFSIFDGNATVQLCMAVIEEFLITIIYLIAGVLATPTRELGNPVQYPKVADTYQLNGGVQRV